MASALGVGARGRQLSEGAQRCAGGFESGQPQTMLPKHLKLLCSCLGLQAVLVSFILI